MSPLGAKADVHSLGCGPAAVDPKRPFRHTSFHPPGRFPTLIVIKDKYSFAAQDRATEEPQTDHEREGIMKGVKIYKNTIM
jgi:hypothetical protein